MARFQVGHTRFAQLSITGNGTIIAAPGVGNSIVVTGVFMIATGATPTIRFDDASGSMTSILSPTAGVPIMMDGDRANPCFACNTNEALSISNFAGTSFNGWIRYMIVNG